MGVLTLLDTGGLRFAIADGTSNKITGAGSATLHGDFTLDATVVNVETVNVTVSGSLPLAAPSLFVRVKAAP